MMQKLPPFFGAPEDDDADIVAFHFALSRTETPPLDQPTG
jgi:hypothetical protein